MSVIGIIVVLSYSRVIWRSGSESKQCNGKLCFFRITCAVCGECTSHVRLRWRQ
jgi:hypothetical protein